MNKITNQKIRYFNITWISESDGPGKRLVVFLQGCNLDCAWCHSPHSQPAISPLLYFSGRCIGCKTCVDVCKNGVHTYTSNTHKIDRTKCTKCGDCVSSCPTSMSEKNGGALFLPTRTINVEDLFSTIKPQLELLKNIGGITISGGEPLMQPDAVSELAKRCKEMGVHTALETSGIIPINNIKKALPYIDTWLIGIRLTNGRQAEISTQFVKNTIKLLELLTKNNKEIIARIPIIPGHTSTEEYLLTAKKITTEFNIQNTELLPFNPETTHYYNASDSKPSMVFNKQEADAAFLKAQHFFDKTLHPAETH